MSYIDRLCAVAGHPDAPADERRSARHDLFVNVSGGLSRSDLIPAAEILDSLPRLTADAGGSFAKSVVLEPTIYADTYPGKYANDPRRASHKAILYVNELGLIGPGADRFAEKRSGGLEFLKLMASELDFVEATTRTQIRDVAPYTRRYRDEDNNPFGYRWQRNDGERPTKDDQKEMDRFDAILQNCGTVTDPLDRRWGQRRRAFDGFTKTVLADSLTMDACPIETERARNGKLIGWRSLDPLTIRLAYEDGYDGHDEIVAIQMLPQERVPIVGFERDELIFEVRNPRSSVYQYDYGVAELECFIRAATAYLEAFTFNSASVSRNSIPRGVLSLLGDFERAELLSFKEQMRDNIRGAANRFGMPIIAGKPGREGTVTWTPIGEKDNEMLATKWIVYLLSIWCAVSGVSPEKIHQESFASRTSALSGDKTEQKLDASNDQSRVPLVLWFFNLVNTHLVGQLTDKYSLVPVGLFPQDENRRHERDKLGSTVNEIRSMNGAEPLKSKLLGEAPVNPSLLSLYMQEQGLATPDGQDGDGAGGDDQGAGVGAGLPSSEQPLAYGREDGGQPGKDRNGARAGGGTPFGKARALTGPPRLVVDIRELPMEGA